jgi:ADP-ribose pyrophosphatase
MTQGHSDEVVYGGRFLKVVRRGTWEFVTRAKATGVVAIIALHDDGRLVLVQQRRPPVNADVLELPAGLAGDGDGDESLLTAAQRELLEETGYEARDWQALPSALSSGGLTDEEATFFLARGLTRRHDGGGVEGESITLHEVPLRELSRWLSVRLARGIKMDAKLLAGVWLAQAALASDR